MFCVRCGTANNEQAFQCAQCGSPLGATAVARPVIPAYLWQAICVTLFCCLPLGIAAIIKSRAVTKALTEGNYAKAQTESDSTKQMLIYAVIGGVVAVLVRVAAEFAK